MNPRAALCPEIKHTHTILEIYVHVFFVFVQQFLLSIQLTFELLYPWPWTSWIKWDIKQKEINCSQRGQNYRFHPRMKKEDELNGKFRRGMDVDQRHGMCAGAYARPFTESTVPQEKVLELLHGHCGLVPSKMMKKMPLPSRMSQSTREVSKETIIQI